MHHQHVVALTAIRLGHPVSVQRAGISGEMSDENSEGAAGEAREKLGGFWNTSKECFWNSREWMTLQCTEKSSKMRYESFGVSNMEVTVNWQFEYGGADKSLMGAASGENGRKDPKTAWTESLSQCFALGGTTEKNPFTCPNFQNGRENGHCCNCVRCHKDTVDAEQSLSRVWVLLTTAKAHFVLKTTHRKLVPEIQTLNHCGQGDHPFLLQAPSTGRGANTLQDMLLCGPLPSTERSLKNKISKLMGAMHHYAHTWEIQN